MRNNDFHVPLIAIALSSLSKVPQGNQWKTQQIALPNCKAISQKESSVIVRAK